MTITIPNRLRLIALLGCLTAAAVACGGDESTTEAATVSTTASESASTAVSAAESTAESEAEPATASFPMTVQNCGVDVVFEQSPQRVVLLEAAGVTLLDSVDALDRVIARVGTYPTEYYSDDVNAAIAAIPELASGTGQTGGVEISLETIIDTDPDLVLGYETETITRDALANSGIDLYVIPPFCDEAPPVSFESIYAEVELYGRIFDNSAAADTVADELRATVDDLVAEPVAEGTTAAALYVSSQGPPLYVYSSLGMVHPQMEALGLVNLFADLPERVPEVSLEELIDRNPEVLILLYAEPDVPAEQIVAQVVDAPGADAISAVANGRVHPLLFNFAEPPSPLVVEGLEILRGVLAE
jgi:iron complex transport system substrate-binding protein